MITTREIDVSLNKGRARLNQVTTKDIDASIKIEQPKEPIKRQSISTNSLPDVADIAEKRKRAKVLEQKKAQEKEIAAKEKMAKVRAAKKK